MRSDNAEISSLLRFYGPRDSFGNADKNNWKRWLVNSVRPLEKTIFKNMKQDLKQNVVVMSTRARKFNGLAFFGHSDNLQRPICSRAIPFNGEAIEEKDLLGSN